MSEGPKPVTKKLTIQLSCALTPVEFEQRAKALAATASEMHSEEDRQDSIKAGLKATLSDISKRRSMLADIVTRCEEMRDVEADELFDFSTGRVVRSRTDTGEVVLTRPMTGEERQRGLFGEV